MLGGANAGFEAGLPPLVLPSAAVLAAYLAVREVRTVARGAVDGTAIFWRLAIPSFFSRVALRCPRCRCR